MGCGSGSGQEQVASSRELRTFGIHKMQGVSCIVENLVAFQEGLFHVVSPLVGWLVGWLVS
jgi:putative Mn2+ efflux pump MntP